VKILNQNIVNWLTSFIVVKDVVIQTNVAQKFADCLNAPNYTVFSNTTSAQQWNVENKPTVVSLESPHNSIHLAVGGFDVRSIFDASPISGANGDMGENNTAGLDPIFYFHHCFIDRVFWLWQKKNYATHKLEIMNEYPGTNSVDSQGPTPGITPNIFLDLKTPLNPFKKEDGTTYTSEDCINIKKLGYDYGPGSLETEPLGRGKQDDLKSRLATPVIAVSGIDRARIRGSFLIAAFATIGNEKRFVGLEAVLSRWNVQNCTNCQAHLEVKAFFPDKHREAKTVETDEVKYEIKLITRDPTPPPAERKIPAIQQFNVKTL